MAHENTVELIGHYGGDLTHSLSAWTSTARELTDEKRARVPQLLAKLATDRHTTPFEKSCLHFLVTTDIATHIHIIKHRIGVSVNAESARYKELKDDKFYAPADWPDDIRESFSTAVMDAFENYHRLITELEARGVDRKRAKESARYILPYANQIRADVMFNFLSFSHFLKLRADAHAQVEVRGVALEMLRLTREIPGAPFRHSLAAFGYWTES